MFPPPHTHRNGNSAKGYEDLKRRLAQAVYIDCYVHRGVKSTGSNPFPLDDTRRIYAQARAAEILDESDVIHAFSVFADQEIRVLLQRGGVDVISICPFYYMKGLFVAENLRSFEEYLKANLKYADSSELCEEPCLQRIPGRSDPFKASDTNDAASEDTCPPSSVLGESPRRGVGSPKNGKHRGRQGRDEAHSGRCGSPLPCSDCPIISSNNLGAQNEKNFIHHCDHHRRDRGRHACLFPFAQRGRIVNWQAFRRANMGRASARLQSRWRHTFHASAKAITDKKCPPAPFWS